MKESEHPQFLFFEVVEFVADMLSFTALIP